ncbi:methylornithine synthase PylB [Desulforhopalus vacuolatus]|uniref:methylornithine synthase PylB n=1 Tax=Desulforhopalus vacuolatus TaxID=40414 RepID=UPI001962DF07|nr:methylornithine synthase PylB [Desulforhopalus vacuolatus]MBM9520406.1 methylornithine synthase PylB [Desulforhopalus vacuolatus]
MFTVSKKNTSLSFDIIDRLAAHDDVGKKDVELLLSLSKKDEIDYLFAAARRARTAYFGNTVFIYGFLYFSTHCRNDCHFCQYRRTNTEIRRYRKTMEEILTAADEMKQSGVHLIDLTMGEDPWMFARGSSRLSRFSEIAEQVKKRTELPVMLSPGVMELNQLTELARMGMEWFACYQETYNRVLFKELRPGQDFEKRMLAKNVAREHGMLVEEGILLGAGSSPSDIIDSLYAMKREGFDQVRAMRFVESKGVTLPAADNSPANQEFLTIALMRLLMPEVLIPASLDVDGLKGLSVRLAAGANVVTSVVPPDRGLAGVANASLDIEESRRSIEQILPILKEAGLEMASHEEYQTWVDSRRRSSGAKSASENRRCA